MKEELLMRSILIQNSYRNFRIYQDDQFSGYSSIVFADSPIKFVFDRTKEYNLKISFPNKDMMELSFVSIDKTYQTLECFYNELKESIE